MRLAGSGDGHQRERSAAPLRNGENRSWADSRREPGGDEGAHSPHPPCSGCEARSALYPHGRGGMTEGTYPMSLLDLLYFQALPRRLRLRPRAPSTFQALPSTGPRRAALRRAANHSGHGALRAGRTRPKPNEVQPNRLVITNCRRPQKRWRSELLGQAGNAGFLGSGAQLLIECSQGQTATHREFEIGTVIQREPLSARQFHT